MLLPRASLGRLGRPRGGPWQSLVLPRAVVDVPVAPLPCLLRNILEECSRKGLFPQGRAAGYGVASALRLWDSLIAYGIAKSNESGPPPAFTLLLV